MQRQVPEGWFLSQEELRGEEGGGADACRGQMGLVSLQTERGIRCKPGPQLPEFACEDSQDVV